MAGGFGLVADVVSPAPRAIWQQLLHADHDALLEQGPRWVDAMGMAAGWRDASRLYELTDGRRFVVPLVRRHELSLAPQSGYAPAWGIGGIVGPDLDATAALAIDADLSASPALWVHLRPNPSQGSVWRQVETAARTIPRRAHLLPLGCDPDRVFAGFSQSARRHVRNADKHGVQYATTTGGAELATYYDELFLPSVQRWAAMQNEPLVLARARAKRRDPLAKLEAIAASLGESFRLTLARVDGQIAAGNIVLVGPNAHYTRGAINDRALKTGAAYGAMWHTMRHCCEAGVRWFHMGETGTSASLARYKESFGAHAVDYDELRYERVPLLALDQRARSVAKKLIRFKDEPAQT